MAASTQLAGWRQGRPPRLISFVYGATKFHGAQFDGPFVSRQGWGPRSGDSTTRLIQASSDGRSFPSRLHSLGFEIGPWPTEMPGLKRLVVRFGPRAISSAPRPSFQWNLKSCQSTPQAPLTALYEPYKEGRREATEKLNPGTLK